MCNIAKLRGKIVENGLNLMTFAKAIEMDKSTLNRRMKNGEAFSIGEARRIATILKLTKEEAVEIFFTNTVA